MTDSSRLIRWGALSAMLGGAVWLASVVLYASQPQGIADAPREGWFRLGYGLPIAWALIAPGVFSVYFAQKRRAGALSTAAAVISTGGLIASGVVYLGTLLGLVPYGPPLLAALGVLLFGHSLLGYSTIKARIISPGAGGLLGLGTLGFLRGNFDDATVFLFIPYGVAWVWLGYLLAGDEDEAD